MRIDQTRKLHAAGILPSPAPTEDVDALRERLSALRLSFAAEALGDLLTDAVKTQATSAGFLDALLRLELERQEERRIVQSIRISHLPTGPTITNFDFAFQPSVSRSQIETLATCQWIRDHQGLLLQGPPGVGKSHLATALGMRAIESGFSVCFARIDELLHQLKRDKDINPARLKHKKYMSSALLIVDEFGYQAFNREEANLFFSRRESSLSTRLDRDHDEQRHRQLAGSAGRRRSPGRCDPGSTAAFRNDPQHPRPQLPPPRS